MCLDGLMNQMILVVVFDFGDVLVLEIFDFGGVLCCLLVMYEAVGWIERDFGGV